MAGTVLLGFILLLNLATYTNGQRSSIPEITDYSALNDNYLPENVKVGAVIGTIKAFDPDGNNVTFYIQGPGGEYFSIDRDTGVVTLKKLLDFEQENEIKMIIRVIDSTGQVAQTDAKVFVNDENDNRPVFAEDAIFQTISESEAPGTIVTFISVSDRDTKNDALTVTCTPSTPDFADACNKFRLELIRNSNRFWRGNIVLNQRLDYEQRNSYAILLTVDDGLYQVTNEVHIEVEDVNDSPPRWIRNDPKSINEEEPIGTVIQTVQAVDQDSTAKRPIRYELVNPPTSGSEPVFAINSTTGIITNRVRIDYDEGEQPKGVPYDVTIRARELLPGGTLGNDALTTADVTIKITVKDIDDNVPTFKEDGYTAYINENIASFANIPGLQMTVTDIDSGTFNSFDLVTLDHDEVFGIIPDSDAASSSVTLFVKNGQQIDYESGPKEYIIRVEARENQVIPALTGSTTVTIIVRDVNDETPTFEADSNNYVRDISELSQPDAVVIDLNAVDREAGTFGTSGIRYRLFGNVPAHFKIDERDGIIRVAACNAPGEPGKTPCIDYERKKRYTLTVSATDDEGRGRTRSVQVTVNILDENDNIPQLDDQYIRYIYEGETVTVNPLRIDADDPDTVGGPLIFTLSGDGTSLWQIVQQTDPATSQVYGNITAVKAIKFEDAPNDRGEFDLTVIVRDRKSSQAAPVKIIVIDINNNSPEFVPTEFVERIPEDTAGDVFVTTVTASDGDAPTTGNGIVDFSITTGALGKFRVKNVRRFGDKYVADIYTTPDATFDYEIRNQYDITLLARDRGTPESKSGTAKLTVIITDINNRNPRIKPTFQSINVYENEPIGTSVYRVTAEDPDADSLLRYFMSAVSATDGAGRDVNSATYDFTDLFRIDDQTGDVIVNGPLDRDRASRIRNSLTVRDITPDPDQEGTGTLLIHILEYNDQAPRFEFPLYEITIDEELNRNSFVLNLNCRDEDDKIAGYGLTHVNPRRSQYFSLLPGSGSMIVSDRIDFEKIEMIELSATCRDTGEPQRSNTTRIIVRIRNLNDNTPVFNQTFYNAKIPEGNAGGDLGVTVKADDLDKGDYGVVRYRLEPSPESSNFTIDPINGKISIKPDASFDRESSGFFGFQVVAYDSPLNASVRKQSTVPVYVQITDINDNCPVFSEKVYSGSIPESADRETDVLDVIANDDDDGNNAQLTFAMKRGSGNPPETENYFRVNTDNGRVSIAVNLKGRSGTYYFNITATDMPDNSAVACTTEVPVIIIVQESINNAPEWIRPPQRDFVIYVLESQYRGMFVYNSKAIDRDRGKSGVVDYFFRINDTLGPKTSDFNINQVTGVISAEVVFDREQKDKYYLTLMAKDQGDPAASSETTLTVVILDVDDNDPVFPMRAGQVTPLILDDINENVVPGQPLGLCSATDADSDHENNEIHYKLLTTNVEEVINVDPNNCTISLIKTVDFEARPSLQFDIYAYNERNDDSVRRYRREANPSILPVTINFKDANDNKPVFTQDPYFACVSINAAFNEHVVVVSATDKDFGDSARLVYSLAYEGAFSIDSVTGTISNIISFSSTSPRNFKLTAFVSDGDHSVNATVHIFVTSPSNIVKLTINRPLTDVEPFQQQIETIIKDSLGAEFACIDEVEVHAEDGEESADKTDVYMAVVRKSGNDYTTYTASQLVTEINRHSEDGYFSSIDVMGVEKEDDDDDISIDDPEVLAIFIICILLVFLALILLCLACYCIRDRKKKDQKKLRAERHTIVQVADEPVETSFNPVYKQPPEDEYAVVSKTARPGPITPVVIPAPEHLEPLESEEPKHFEPVEPEVDEPVIETEVVGEQMSEPVHEHRPSFEPEYEDKIETEVRDEPIEDELVQNPEPFPEPIDDEEIETSIRGDSLPPSPAASPQSSRASPQNQSPPSSPQNQSPRASPQNQSPRASPSNQSPRSSPQNRSPRSTPPASPEEERRYARDSD